MKKAGQKILGKKILFVTAHPDDESFLAAGTMYRNHEAGGENFLACATFGEKGRAYLKKPATETQLKEMRKKELAAACKFLHVKKLFHFNLPDGKVNLKKATLKKLLNKALRTTKPSLVISFGKDGITGHKDHIAVGLAAKQLAQIHKLPIAAFVAVPSLNKKLLLSRRKYGVYTNKISRPKANLIISINPKIKLKALRFHSSQMESVSPLLNFPKQTRQSILNKEYFRF